MTTIKQISKIYTNSQVVDRPDERDYKHDELFGTNEGRPTEYYTKLSDVLDQGNTMRCTLYSMEGAMTEQNAIEATDKGEADIYEKAKPNRFLKEAKRKGFSESIGWYIQAPLDLYKQMGKIAGYGVVKKDIDSICSAILTHGAVMSGSNTLDWGSTGIDGIAKLGNGGGHAFWICGYNTIRRQFLIRNSWGANWGPFNGYFWLDFDMINELFTCYVPYDVSDAPTIYAYKAIRKGLSIATTVQEFRAEDYATRLETATFILRSKSGIEIQNLFNGMRANDLVTMYELETMLKRAGYNIEQPKGEENVKRWEVVKNITTIL